MERPSTLHNLWLLTRLVGSVLLLEGVLEFITDRHSITLFRNLVTCLLDRDPSTPRLPDTWEEWEEWYNT
jgi:hypothetical protein